MVEKIGYKMVAVYLRQLKKYGYSPKSLGWMKGKQGLRFERLTRFIKKNSKILDYGCGFGDLMSFLELNNLNVDYSGCDVIPEFLEIAKEKNPKGNFFQIELFENIKENYDNIICSGTFNILYHKEIENHKKHIFKIINNLFQCCKNTLSIDFQSPYVDFHSENAYHQEINEIINYSIKYLSRRFVVDHSYMPYEYTIHIFKNDKIKKPKNIF